LSIHNHTRHTLKNILPNITKYEVASSKNGFKLPPHNLALVKKKILLGKHRAYLCIKKTIVVTFQREISLTHQLQDTFFSFAFDLIIIWKNLLERVTIQSINRLRHNKQGTSNSVKIFNYHYYTMLKKLWAQRSNKTSS